MLPGEPFGGGALKTREVAVPISGGACRKACWGTTANCRKCSEEYNGAGETTGLSPCSWQHGPFAAIPT